MIRYRVESVNDRRICPSYPLQAMYLVALYSAEWLLWCRDWMLGSSRFQTSETLPQGTGAPPPSDRRSMRAEARVPRTYVSAYGTALYVQASGVPGRVPAHKLGHVVA